IQTITTPGGIQAWLVEDHSVPVISLKFAFAGAGTALDPDDKQGLVQLLSNTMDEGAGDLDSQTFQKTLADNSIGLGFSASRDDFSGGLQCLTRYSGKAFDLLRLSLTAPRFDAEPVQRMKDANISRIRTSMSDPDWMAARLMNDTAYAGHVYARNSGGTIAGLQSVTPDDLRAFAATRLARDHLLVAVAGDIKKEDLIPVLDRIFGKLPAASPKSSVPDLTVQNAGSVTLMKKDLPQTIIQMTQPGISRTDPDWQTARVMNFILGSSGFGSRLMEEVREKRGLTYGIYTGLSTLDHVNTLTLQTSTRNDKAKDVIDLIHAEWTRMKTTDVTEQELAEAKSYLIGSMPLSLTSTDNISDMMLSLMLDGLPDTYLDTVGEKISAVAIADIRRVAEKLLTPDGIVAVLVGNPADITPTRTVETLPNVE
ncbi:MAG TPA: pitrilysin family protein, partial [Micavibrio sp.]